MVRVRDVVRCRHDDHGHTVGRMLTTDNVGRNGMANCPDVSRMTWTALSITSAGRSAPVGVLGIGPHAAVPNHDPNTYCDGNHCRRHDDDYADQVRFVMSDVHEATLGLCVSGSI